MQSAQTVIIKGVREGLFQTFLGDLCGIPPGVAVCNFRIATERLAGWNEIDKQAYSFVLGQVTPSATALLCPSASRTGVRDTKSG